MNESRLVIAGVLDEIPRARQFVAETARSMGMDDRGIHQCELAIDEACTNIIEHGYQANGFNQTITITLRLQMPNFIIMIADFGPPYNPLNHPDPDPWAPLDERRAGSIVLLRTQSKSSGHRQAPER
jgi:anti-sigma regulatory factor (Ser/Thr protein kinase)